MRVDNSEAIRSLQNAINLAMMKSAVNQDGQTVARLMEGLEEVQETVAEVRGEGPVAADPGAHSAHIDMMV